MRRHNRERGASLVEFALVVPMLTLFLFGIVQFGIAYDKQQSINSAAREGARLGALQTSTLDDVALRSVDSYGASAAAGEDPTIAVYDDLGNVHGARCSNGVYRADDGSDDVCDPLPGSDSIDETAATEMPCGEDPENSDGEDETPSDFLIVTASTPYDITIPFFGVMSVTIDSEAQFRCE